VPDVTTLLQLLRDELYVQERRRDLETDDEATPPPVVPVAPAAVDALVQRYSLPPAYQAILLTLGRQGISVLPGPFQELVIYAAPELERAQVGFRGPRLGDDGFVAPHGWRRTWIVIAFDHGDPYFLDVTKTLPDGDSPVWTAMHGTGTWEPRLAASSLSQFLQILRVWTRIVVPHYDPQNPDEPLDDAHLRRLTNEIAQIDSVATSHWTI
jgi:hypothetical protein